MQHVAPPDAARCNSLEGSGERLRPAKAAARLGINRSSLKRYLDQYPELLDSNGTVDFDELARHRGDNPRVSEQSAETDAPKSAKSESAGRRGTKARLEEIKLLEAERDWALSIGNLVDPIAMLDAATEAASALRDKMMAPEHTVCERMAEERDPRAVREIWREANRVMIEEFIGALTKFARPAASDASG